MLQIAIHQNVDLLLLGGDLFHDNKPSRTTIIKVHTGCEGQCMQSSSCSSSTFSQPACQPAGSVLLHTSLSACHAAFSGLPSPSLQHTEEPCMLQAVKLLTDYCMNDRAVSFEVLSDQRESFASGYGQHLLLGSVGISRSQRRCLCDLAGCCLNPQLQMPLTLHTSKHEPPGHQPGG